MRLRRRKMTRGGRQGEDVRLGKGAGCADGC